MKTPREDSETLRKLSTYTKYDPSLDEDIELTRHNFVSPVAICSCCCKIIQNRYYACIITEQNTNQLDTIPICEKYAGLVNNILVIGEIFNLCPACYDALRINKQGPFHAYDNTQRKKYWSTMSCEKLFYILLQSNFLLW